MPTSAIDIGQDETNGSIQFQEAAMDHPSTSPPSNRHNTDPQRKEKRPPTITPRSFNRFFTPRSSQESPKVSTSREALRTITRTALNRDTVVKYYNGTSRDSLTDPLTAESDVENDYSPQKKRRRVSGPSILDDINTHRPASPHSPSFKRTEFAIHEQKPQPSDIDIIPSVYPTPIQRSKMQNLGWGLIDRSIYGGLPANLLWSDECARGIRQQTSNFYSLTDDVHGFSDLPFCATSCNTNSLVAIGDEGGGVQLLEPYHRGKNLFSKAWVNARPHNNAILDLQFSSDDRLLATACGDQTGVIMDMQTQIKICTLPRHMSSVKQVRFQPESGDQIVVTSGRDGNIHTCDLRTHAKSGPAQRFARFDPDAPETAIPGRWAYLSNQIRGAHWSSPQKPKGLGSSSSTTSLSKPDSVTCLEFLRPNLFVTAAESNACLKVWDMRVSYSNRRGNSMPVSTACEPDKHRNHRQFGITSMTFSGDKARLYSLCRDNTIYAYSTAHLILGDAPELRPTNPSRPRHGQMNKTGLGPLYGFRDPDFHVATFYIKGSIRPAVDGNVELLAVGSSDSCVVLFPTDEKFIYGTEPSNRNCPSPQLDKSETGLSKKPSRPSLIRSSSATSLPWKPVDTIPIYTDMGTCLVKGHRKEVGGLTWSHTGELVTVSDDYTARCWRQGSKARELRRSGSGIDPLRWGCGWADIDDDSDSDSDIE